MSRSHTRSIATQDQNGSFRSVAPVIIAMAATTVKNDDGTLNLDETTFGVKGSVQGVHPHTKERRYLNLDARWCSLPASVVLQAFELGKKDETIHEVRMLSSVAGTRQAPGSEPGVLIELSGSDEAIALATELGVNYTSRMKVGQNNAQRIVEHTNPLIVSMDVLRLLTGQLTFPDLPREEEIEGRQDTWNPDLREALNHYAMTGKLPERNTTRGTQNSEFTEMFDNEAVTLPANRNNRNNARYSNNSY